MPGSVTELSDKVDKQSRTHKKQSGKRRLSRNESEKLRRDKLNMHIAELAKLVPIVASAPRKVDKSSVLRLAVNYLRLHKDLKKMKEFDIWRPGFLTQENLSEALLEAFDGFLLVISQKGIILYVSDLITTLLGHAQMDLLGQSVYSLVHPDDVALCKEQFQIRPKLRQVNGKAEVASCISKSDKSDTLFSVYCSPNKGRRSFFVRMQNLLNRDHKMYDLVHLSCHVRTFLQPEHTGMMGSHSVVIGVGRLAAHQPIKDLSIISSNTQEFITQHTLDGNIIYTDHRQSVCMGRLPREIYGTSPYDYIHQDDLFAIHYSHLKVIREGYIPSTVFRSYTKTGSVVCIQATSSICCDNWTKQPKFILSNNVIISEDEFSILMLKQKEDFSLLVGTQSQSNSAITDSSEDSDREGPASAKRQKLEPPDSQLDSEGPANSTGEQDLSEESCRSSSLLDSHVSPVSSQEPSSKLLLEPMEPSLGSAANETCTDAWRNGTDTTSDGNIGSTAVELQSQGMDPMMDSNKNGSLLANLLYGLRSSGEKGASLPQPVVSSDSGNEPSSTTTDLQDMSFTSRQPDTATESETSPESPASTASGPVCPVSKSSDLKTVMVQNQLSQQLLDKYQQLESTIEKQESELSSLRQHMVRYLLSHPDVQQAYLRRLHALEAKRKQHESTLKRLQEIHDLQQKALLPNPTMSSAQPCSSGMLLKTKMYMYAGSPDDLSSISPQFSVNSVEEKTQNVAKNDPSSHIPFDDIRSGIHQCFDMDSSAEPATDNNGLSSLNDFCCPQVLCEPSLKDHQDDSRMSTFLRVSENSASHVS